MSGGKIVAKRNVFKCSQSKIKVWRRCAYAAHLRYVEGLRRRVKARPLQFGSLVHTMLEADAEAKNPYKALTTAITEQKLFASEREELMEIATDARLIMRDYFDFWEDAKERDQLVPTSRKGKKAEHQIFVEIAPGIELEVKLDMLAETGDGRQVLVEHKTFKQMPSDDHRWRDLQSNIYKRVVDELKIKVDGMCWDYIRSKPPTLPQLLKNGELSQKRLDTLPAALVAFGKERKIEIPDRMLKAAQDNRKKWFLRQFTTFRKPTVAMVTDDFLESARDMAQNLGTRKAKTIDRHCDWCEFESICRAELTGADASFIRKKEFTNREQREREIEEAG
jgi:hypothetical protein